jgi:hypothetical protein
MNSITVRSFISHPVLLNLLEAFIAKSIYPLQSELRFFVHLVTTR